MTIKKLTTPISVLLLSTIVLLLFPKPGHGSENHATHQHCYSDSLKSKEEPSQNFGREGLGRKMMSLATSRIGSAAPTCTRNECRSCRFKCTAEQVPVDANDPINSAYRYRCVCHG